MHESSDPRAAEDQLPQGQAERERERNRRRRDAQSRECICCRRGGLTRADFTETGSASDFNGDRPRPEWDEFRKLVDSGKVAIAAAWEASRFTRKLDEGIAFLKLCKLRDVLVWLSSSSQLYDIEKNSDYKALRDEFIAAEDETSRLSGRLNRATGQSRAAGRQNGRCPYGYTRKYREDTGEHYHEISEAEAAVLRKMFADAYAGTSIATIVQRLNTGKVPPPTRPGRVFTEDGRPARRDGTPINPAGIWRHSSVVAMLTNPVYIGKITKRPSYDRKAPGPRRKVRGEKRDLSPDNLIDAAEGVYPRMVEDEVFYAVAARLTAPSRPRFDGGDTTIRRGMARHLLTHIAVCGDCGASMVPGDRYYYAAGMAQGGNAVKGQKGFQPAAGPREKRVTRYYRCAKLMNVNVREHLADAYVEAEIKKQIAVLLKAGFKGQAGGKALLRAREDLKKAEVQAAQYEALLDSGDNTPAEIKVYTKQQLHWQQKAEVLAEEVRLLTVPPSLMDFAYLEYTDTEGISQTWDKLGLDAKRDVVRAITDEIRMLAAPHGGRGQPPIEDRVRITFAPLELFVADADAAGAAENCGITSTENEDLSIPAR